MTEHRPECYERFAIARTCVVCDALRACEARMRLQAIGSNAQRMLIEHGEDCWRSGYAKALDAAREAVLGAKAIDVYYGRGLDEPPQFIWLNNALAAIDALRTNPVPEHGFCSRQSTMCIHCERECICERLEQAENYARIAVMHTVDVDSYEQGRSDALAAAREAVADINGKWVFGPRIYKHEALTAIDALKEKP